MSVILRIDIDRPYGKKNLFLRTISRIGSDLYFPKINKLGYLNDTKEIITLLNKLNCQAHIFFRRCTLPNKILQDFIIKSGHKIGLHLENSRSLSTFKNEFSIFKNHTNTNVQLLSKHGSGKHRYGLFHYAPYEPEKYIKWAISAQMKVFFGNLEDPSIPSYSKNGLTVFPAAFWLEPYWRDTKKYSVDWLIENARNKDIVVLIHPDNITVDLFLKDQLIKIIKNVTIKVFN